MQPLVQVQTQGAVADLLELVPGRDDGRPNAGVGQPRANRVQPADHVGHLLGGRGLVLEQIGGEPLTEFDQ